MGDCTWFTFLGIKMTFKILKTLIAFVKKKVFKYSIFKGRFLIIKEVNYAQMRNYWPINETTIMTNKKSISDSLTKLDFRKSELCLISTF
jgi:hypothetical protein